MNILTHPIDGHYSVASVSCVANRLFRADQSNNRAAAISAALDVSMLHSGSRFNKWAFSVAGSVALAAALVLPSTEAKVTMSPLAAITLLLARDARRSQKAVQAVMATDAYTNRQLAYKL